MVRDDIQERLDKVQPFTRNVRNLEYRANPVADEMCCCMNDFFLTLDEYRDFPRSGGFHDFRELLDGLLQDVWWANVDFGNDHEDGNVQGESNPKVLSGHANQPVVGGDHEHDIVGRGAEEAEDGGAEVFLVPGEVAEGDDFGLEARELAKAFAFPALV